MDKNIIYEIKAPLPLLLMLFFALTTSCEKIEWTENASGIKVAEVDNIPGFTIDKDPGDTCVVLINQQINDIYGIEGIDRNAELQIINYKEYSVLFGSTGTTNGVNYVDQSFERVSETQFNYSVTIHLNDASVAQGTSYGILTNKLPINANIMFNLIFNRP